MLRNDVRCSIPNLNLVQLSVEGIKRLLPFLRNAKSIDLPFLLSQDSNLGWLPGLVSELPPSVERVGLHEPWTTNSYGNAEPISRPKLLEQRKGDTPVFIEIKAHLHSVSKVKLTSALGSEDDTIDKRDSLNVANAHYENEYYLWKQLRLLQRILTYERS